MGLEGREAQVGQEVQVVRAEAALRVAPVAMAARKVRRDPLGLTDLMAMTANRAQ